MAKVHQIGNKSYAIGKSKSSGLYAIWERRKSGWIKIFTCGEIDTLKGHIAHLRQLAAVRELKQSIADICGTSYAEARRDMGI